MAKQACDFQHFWSAGLGAKIYNAGYRGVIKWLANVTAAECADYLANSLEIALYFENDGEPERMEKGHAAGVADANTAIATATAVGMPTGCVIFFTHDYPTAWSYNATQYMAGVKTQCDSAGYKYGLYGSYYHVIDFGNIDADCIMWQTLGWSGGNIADGIAAYQKSRAHYVASLGIYVDDDDILDSTFFWPNGGDEGGGDGGDNFTWDQNPRTQNFEDQKKRAPGTKKDLHHSFEAANYFSSPAPIYVTDFQRLQRRDKWIKDFKITGGVYNIDPFENDDDGGDELHVVNLTTPIIQKNVVMYSTQFDITLDDSMIRNDHFIDIIDYKYDIDWNKNYCPVPVMQTWWNFGAPGGPIGRHEAKLHIVWKEVNYQRVKFIMFSSGADKILAGDKIRLSLTAIGVIHGND